MITTIVFDIGMVLADFHWKQYVNSFGYSEEKTTRLANATVAGPFWDELDRGVMTFEEVIQACIGLAPDLEPEIRLFYEKFVDIISEYPYAPLWIRTLKQAGYKVYLLSNFGEDLFRQCQDKFTFLREADGGVISYTVKAIKPDSIIYQALLDKYNLIPEETVFIDDRPVNVAGAKALGMNGIIFERKEQTEEELRKMGVNA